MQKNEVYSWRVSSELKTALEDAARRESITVAELLERAVKDWISQQASTSDDDEQQRLHARARSAIGTIAGADPMRAERSRDRLKAKLESRRGR